LEGRRWTGRGSEEGGLALAAGRAGASPTTACSQRPDDGRLAAAVELVNELLSLMVMEAAGMMMSGMGWEERGTTKQKRR